jgi:LppX_LprAFG lipoprotein
MRAVLLLLLVFPLAACGGGGGGKPSAVVSNLTPIAYVKSAAAKTAQAPSEHTTLTASAAVSGQPLTVTGAGDFDNSSHQGSMHADFSVAGLTGTIDEVLDGSTIYMKSPLFADGLPKGKTWLKLDLQKALASKGIDFSALLSQNPAQTLAQLQNSGSVTKVGDETIDGVDTTHYRAVIDPSKLPQGAKVVALTGAKFGPFDVWIGNDDSYVHKLSLSYSIKAPGAKRQSFALTTGFSDFGKSVTVTVPTDAESFDGTSATIKGLGG